MMDATRILLASNWQPNEDSTWFRWVRARDNVDCCSKDSRVAGESVLSTVADGEEAKRIVFCDDEGSLLNLSFLSSFSAFCCWSRSPCGW